VFPSYTSFSDRFPESFKAPHWQEKLARFRNSEGMAVYASFREGSYLHRQAAIHFQDLAGDECGLVGG
jgi:hypothetical protein